MTYLELVAEKNLYDLDKVKYLNNHHIVMTIMKNISRRVKYFKKRDKLYRKYLCVY